MSDDSKEKAAIFAPKVALPNKQSGRTFRLSVVIGALAVIASSVLFLWVAFFQSDNNIAIELNAVNTTPEGRLELQGLTYKGITKQGKRYQMNAERAAEDGSNANLVHLTTITGHIDDEDNGLITLSSQTGSFERVQNVISLRGDVVMTQAKQELVFKTNAVAGDLNKGDFEAPEAVRVTTPNSAITSQAMSVSDFGDKIIFKGQSKAIIGEGDKS